MDLNTLKGKAKTATQEELEDVVGQLANLIDEAASDKSRLATARVHLMKGLLTVAEQLVTGSYTSSGYDALVARQPLALGGSTANAAVGNDHEQKLTALGQEFKDNGQTLSADQVLDMLLELFSGYGKVSETQQTARGIVARKAIDGQLPVRDDTVLVVEAQNDQLRAELAAANAKLHELQEVSTAYNAIANPTDKVVVHKALVKVARLQVPLAADGSLGLANDHPTVVERNSLKTERDALQAAVADVKLNLSSKKFLGHGEYTVLNVDELKDPTWGFIKPDGS